MASPGPIARLLARVPLRARVAAGVAALLVASWCSLYGNIWSFERHDAHRFTARAMLTGTLRMRSVVAMAQHDEQIYNGGVYTNWGFGVPLIQAPFHALAGALHISGGFFPDRAIFLTYAAALLPLVWIAFDRLLRSRPAWARSPRDTRLAVSWAATWVALVMTVYPYVSTRFAIYEETFAYLEICELLALGAYVYANESERLGWVAAVAGAAGLGLLVRPTALVHLGVWGATFALGEVRATPLAARDRAKRTAVFAATAAPFVAFWLYSNEIRSGSYFALGLNNSNPAWIYGTAPQRFGSICIDTAKHAAQAVLWTLKGFFLYVVPRAEPGSWLRRCHVDFEERDGTGEPLLGPVVLALLVWIIARYLRRPRERRLAVYLPFGAMALLFAAYVSAGSQFAWRYVGDFLPLVVLACVQRVQAGRRTDAEDAAAPDPRPSPLTPRLAKVLFWGGFVYFFRYLIPFQWSTRAEVLDAREVAALAADFQESRWGHDSPVPSRLTCGGPRGAFFHDGLGWNADCSVYTFTNVYLGVPPREDGRYRLRIAASGFDSPALRVYVNGRIYLAAKQDGGYVADVTISNAALTSPIVMATVEWVRALDPPAGRLLSIELG
jgi:hypothetical protein